MTTLILNGSPHGEKGNSQIFIDRFLRGVGAAYEVRQVAGEPPEELARYMESFEVILIFMPLYVFAMPGIVRRLFEFMRPADGRRSLGFVVQYGFAEGSHAGSLVRYLDGFCRRLQYQNLGVVTKGNAAGVGMMPEGMNRKLFGQLEALGAYYARHHALSPQLAETMRRPYTLKRWQARATELMNRTGIGYIFWHRMLKSNGAYERRRDRPFVDDPATGGQGPTPAPLSALHGDE